MKYIIIPILILTPILIFSQSNPLPLGSQAYHILDRMEIKNNGNPVFHSALKFYTRSDVVEFAYLMDSSAINWTRQDLRDLNYLFLDNNEWLGQNDLPYYLGEKRGEKHPTQIERSLQSPKYQKSKKALLNLFYPTPANLIEVNKPAFHLRVNPIVNIQVFSGGGDEGLFISQRGTDLRGGIDDKIYFHTQIIDNQGKYPGYVEDYVDQYNALPGVGFLKTNKNRYFGLEGGYDYLISSGYLGFNLSQHVGLQFGYGQNFIGNGYRSLLLSNFAYNYLYLKLNWKVWKLHYQNIFAELTLKQGLNPGNILLPKKYMAAHHLSFQLFPSLNIGIFESVIFSRTNQLELRYLQPVIFYRTIEQGLGSPDNVLLGVDIKWNLFNRLQLYGQLALDEFVFNEAISENRGWWGNKTGIQLGGKYIDVLGVDHLDLQVEYNTVRPYTYSHIDGVASYTHYNQSLAHPLGANFKEWVVIARYQPIPKLQMEARLISADVGEDADDSNWGGNLLLPNTSREQNYGNEIGQGIGADITLFGLDISYQMAHNVFLDFQYFNRKKDSRLDVKDQMSSYLGGGIRINIGRQRMDF
jgi:hypothetical protein